VCDLVEELKELEVDYYELAKSPSLKDDEDVKQITPKDKRVKFQDLVKRKDDNPISVRKRLDLLERKTDEFERSLVLLNKNLNEIRRDLETKWKKIEEIQKNPKTPEEVKNELSSLKSLVEGVSQVNSELKQKTPTMLRELEKKVESFNEKIGSLDKKIEKIKKENEDLFWDRPVILE
jgi:chromosome segregation ATPase